MSYDVQVTIVGDADDGARSVTIATFDELADARAMKRRITKLIFSALEIAEEWSDVVKTRDSPT